MKKVLITPRSFGKYNREEIAKLFEAHGIEAIYNPVGQILTQSQMMDAIQGMDGVIIGVDPLNREVLQQGKRLKAISKYGVGTDNIDMEYARERDIAVSRTVGANANAVADYSFALLMAVARRLTEINDGCKQNDWAKKISLDVYGKKLGVLGLGAIGKGVAMRAKGFHMEVYGYDIVRDDVFLEESGVQFTDVDTIIRECDFISIHLPLTPETKHLLNRDCLKYAKENLIIVNTSRGGIINENDLYELILDGKIYGAGLDVFEEEPPQNSKLLTLKRVIVGSHTAASTIGATREMSMMAAKNIIRDLEESCNG